MMRREPSSSRGGGPPGEPPIDRPKSGEDNGAMEARVARLEASVAHIERDLGEIKLDLREVRKEARADFRLTWGAIIAGFIGTAALLARGFGWL